MAHSEELQIGDYVHLRGQASLGEIVDIVGKQAVVAFDTLTLRAPLCRLDKAPDDVLQQAPTLSAPARSYHIASQAFSSFHPEIDLHGMSVESALQAVDQWVDQAVLVGHKHLKVIHGKGTGVLRQAVRTHLQSHVHVQRVIAQHPYPGGTGVTWIEIV